MPEQPYGILKGRVARRSMDRDPVTPHYQMLLEANGHRFHLAVNIQSGVDGSELLHAIDTHFRHPVTDHLRQLPAGFTELPNCSDSGALDYIRGRIVKRIDFHRSNPAERQSGGLAALLDHHIRRAVDDPAAIVYAYGRRWGPKPGEIDRTFHGHPISPSDGLHDIHMNQGNPDRLNPRHSTFVHENGVWQDGALIVQLPGNDEWIAIFLMFADQVWRTDDQGRPIIRRF
jgi:uncharacterized protein YukJ